MNTCDIENADITLLIVEKKKWRGGLLHRQPVQLRKFIDIQRNKTNIQVFKKKLMDTGARWAQILDFSVKRLQNKYFQRIKVKYVNYESKIEKWKL